MKASCVSVLGRTTFSARALSPPPRRGEGWGEGVRRLKLSSNARHHATPLRLARGASQASHPNHGAAVRPAGRTKERPQSLKGEGFERPMSIRPNLHKGGSRASDARCRCAGRTRRPCGRAHAQESLEPGHLAGRPASRQWSPTDIISAAPRPRVERVERVAQIGEELDRRCACSRCEAHVVGFERIGDDEVGSCPPPFVQKGRSSE
jgi:hypothetical protein